MPLRERNPKLPPTVADLCTRCLAKDPKNRYSSAGELVEAIRKLRRTGSRPWRLVAVAAAGLMVLCLLAIARLADRDDPNGHQTPGPTRREVIQGQAADPKPQPRSLDSVESVQIESLEVLHYRKQKEGIRAGARGNGHGAERTGPASGRHGRAAGGPRLLAAGPGDS